MSTSEWVLFAVLLPVCMIFLAACPRICSYCLDEPQGCSGRCRKPKLPKAQQLGRSS